MDSCVDKYNLKEKFWIDSYTLIWDDILRTAEKAEMDIKNNELSILYQDVYDNELIPFRKHCAVSLLYTLKLSQCVSNDPSWKSIFEDIKSEKLKNTMVVCNESSILPAIFLGFIMLNYQEFETRGRLMIQDCIKTIILNNGRNSKTQSGLLPPYFDINFMVECMVGLNGVRNDVDFKLGSYYLKSFIEILVRLEDREFISSWWKEISFMHFNEFVPDKQIDYYRLHCQTGTNMTTVPKKEKRWKELNEEANLVFTKFIPPSFKKFPEVIPFYLLLFPFRANSITMGFLHATVRSNNN